MALWQTILISILVVIAIVMGIVAVYFATKDKKEKKKGDFVFNFMPHHSQGFAYGHELPDGEENSKRQKLVYTPASATEEDIENLKENPSIIADKKKIITIAKGRFDKNKAIKIVLPESPEMLPPDIKETDIGRMLSYEILIDDFNEWMENLYNEDRDRAKKISKELALGNLSEEWMEKFKSLILRDVQDNMKNKSQGSGSSSNTNFSNMGS